jgi:hypothetical protein
VLQWVGHWRESAPYDYCGSEAEWLADLEEVIAAMRQNAPKHPERRWPANTNADQLVRAGVVGEKDLNQWVDAEGEAGTDRSDAAPPKDGDDRWVWVPVTLWVGASFSLTPVSHLGSVDISLPTRARSGQRHGDPTTAPTSAASAARRTTAQCPTPAASTRAFPARQQHHAQPTLPWRQTIDTPTSPYRTPTTSRTRRTMDQELARRHTLSNISTRNHLTRHNYTPTHNTTTRTCNRTRSRMPTPTTHRHSPRVTRLGPARAPVPTRTSRRHCPSFSPNSHSACRHHDQHHTASRPHQLSRTRHRTRR